MNNLKLITTETFNNLSCNFYRNMNDDILLTREQIGQALEYSDPIDSIYRIHKRHQDRLDSLSVCLSDGLGHDIYYYTEKGIMEICRWSKSKRANEFMDWTWDIISKYRHGELETIDIQSLLDSIAALSQKIDQLQEVVTKKDTAQANLPEKKYSRWKTNTFTKLRTLLDYVNAHTDQNLMLADVMRITINEMQDTYDIELSDYVRSYMFENGLRAKPYDLDVINNYKELRTLYTSTVDAIMARLNLQPVIIQKNIFDELAAKM